MGTPFLPNYNPTTSQHAEKIREMIVNPDADGYAKTLNQRGPTTFALRAILQKRDNLRVTSNKMMYKTRCSQDLK